MHDQPSLAAYPEEGGWICEQVAGTLSVSRERCFAVLDDYSTWSAWAFGLRSLEVLSSQVSGTGTELAAVVDVGPVKLKSRGVIVDHEAPSRVALQAGGGVEIRAGITLVEVAPDRTDLAVELSYRVGRGVAGRVLAKAFPPFVKAALRRSEVQLREYLERTA